MIKKKIQLDSTLLIKNKFQFSHTIDELLHFDKQLKSYLKECNTYDRKYFYGCLHILCENELLFSNWLSLERQVCQKNLDAMFANLNQTGMDDKSSSLDLLGSDKQLNDIWCCDYSDIDKMKPPHCAESFMSMVKAITGILLIILIFD